MPRGGRQPGAGRPKGSKGTHTIKAEQAREYFQKRLESELEPIIDKQIEQAKAGDDKARSDLYNRAYGKPKETVEVQGFDFIFANDDKQKEGTLV